MVDKSSIRLFVDMTISLESLNSAAWKRLVAEGVALKLKKVVAKKP